MGQKQLKSMATNGISAVPQKKKKKHPAEMALNSVEDGFGARKIAINRNENVRKHEENHEKIRQHVELPNLMLKNARNMF